MLLGASLFAGKIEMADHRVYEGAVSFREDGRLMVIGTNGAPESLALGQVRVASLHPRLEQTNLLPKGWHFEAFGGAHGNAEARDGGFWLRLAGGYPRDPQINPGHFVYRVVRSDPEITTRLERVEGSAQSAAGLMLRANLDPAGDFVLLAATPGQQLRLESRTSDKVRRQELGTLALPIWLKLAWQQQGGSVLAYRSADGLAWEKIGQSRLDSQAEPFPEDSDHWQPKLYAGLALDGAETNTAATACFGHVALTVQGLLGAYYNDEKFSSLRFARLDREVNFFWGEKPPAPDLAAARFSVRWIGQVEPKYSEAYRFHFEADDSARLWINGRELPAAKFSAKPELYEEVKELALEAGRKCELKFEFMNEEGAAGARLGWSSRSQKLEAIPGTSLSHTYMPGSLDEENEGSMTNICHAKGIYLRDGSFIAGEIVSADQTTAYVTFAGQAKVPIPTSKIARVVFRNVRRPLAFGQVGDQMTGVFLRNGDFLESEFILCQDRSLVMCSVLFGRRVFATQDVNTAVLVLNRYAPARSPLEVSLLDGSVLRIKGIRLAEAKILVDDFTLGFVSIPETQLIKIYNPVVQ